MIDKNNFIILNGVDIVSNLRIKKLLERSPSAIYDIYSQEEISYCQRKKNSIHSFAVRFAAKEAVIKATDSHIFDYELYNIEVLNTDTGKPYLNIKSENLKNKISLLLKKEKYEINLTLSHEKEFSIAHIIIY